MKVSAREVRHKAPARYLAIAACAALTAFLGACERKSAPEGAPALGLPPIPYPADNPPTGAKKALGEKLFFDRRLSFNGTMSCAMCHVPEQGFTVNELATPVGMEGASVRRNAPTILNVAYHPRLFHDGRDGALETQIWGPLLAVNEMGNPSVGHVIDTLRNLADYKELFEGAFDGQGATADTIGRALATYERSLIAGGSRFDCFRYAGRNNALHEVERAGYALFTGKAHCAGCHLIGEKTALFSDFRYHNTGIGWRHAQQQESYRVDLGGGASADVSGELVRRLGDPDVNDLGRFEITQDPADRWAYKTPMLREVARTAPYMHDGSLRTLEAVVAYYNAGGAGAPDQATEIVPLGLSADEEHALVAFLRSLNGRATQACD
ncbi:MAG TPA: cytochrome c peroxidase [Burkholderiaceae bacterium]|nr:cytochrome c peroxidase [Burkholderiaceae bacterium]